MVTVRLAIFLFWTTMILAGAVSASYYAWSPYSEEERSASGGRSGGAFVRGPTHK